METTATNTPALISFGQKKNATFYGEFKYEYLLFAFF
jgi:hypothetical protein